MLDGMLNAMIMCQNLFRANNVVDKQMANDMLYISEMAYKGGERYGEFVKIDNCEVPSAVTALINSTRGLRVWLGKSDKSIVVAFSGTDIKNPDMITADIVQLSATSTLYMKGAELLRIMLEHFSDKDFFVTGHSLGGGLAQFAVVSCIEMARVWAYCFNPAGLSQYSLNHLGAKRLRDAKDHIFSFRTALDVVSLSGGVLGTLVTLPLSQKNGHSIGSLKSCMMKYLN